MAIPNYIPTNITQVLFLNFFLKILILIYVFMWGFMPHEHSAHGGRREHLISCSQSYRTLCGHLIWMLRTEPRSCGRASSVLIHSAISLGPGFLFATFSPTLLITCIFQDSHHKWRL